MGSSSCSIYYSVFDSLFIIFAPFIFHLVTNGVYVERFDRIDYNRVKFLLTDKRYPNLPTLAICLPTFEQPANWSNFFGSRVRAYFVPMEDGNHFFYLCKDTFLFPFLLPCTFLRSFQSFFLSFSPSPSIYPLSFLFLVPALIHYPMNESFIQYNWKVQISTL